MEARNLKLLNLARNAKHVDFNGQEQLEGELIRKRSQTGPTDTDSRRVRSQTESIS